jgi:hypothetical protein
MASFHVRPHSGDQVAKANTDMPRRGLILGLACSAAAALVLPLAPVAAQTTQAYNFDASKLAWQQYLRNDFGFRIEFPGRPRMMDDESPRSKGTSAEVMFDRVTFGVTVWEFPSGGTMTSAEANKELDGVAYVRALTFGVKPLTTRFIIDGSPGREDIFEFKDSIMHYRSVVHGGRIVQVSVLRSQPDDDIKLAADHFLQSFTLLPTP